MADVAETNHSELPRCGPRFSGNANAQFTVQAFGRFIRVAVIEARVSCQLLSSKAAVHA